MSNFFISIYDGVSRKCVRNRFFNVLKWVQRKSHDEDAELVHVFEDRGVSFGYNNRGCVDVSGAHGEFRKSFRR